ncbi:MAG: preprotein translocase subunit SecE [Candidatus Faecalibacterium intestinavium]|uniref:Protein translocase subunit SecE n=1 Tax=Candidatus Faecalibacterium intestinavium TaxID=2838580 RepID=A0A9E2KK34_9FIRM|nr:preprotein translocase subunit SecE [Candidatus Faecalibacterium intestinavium]
MADKTENKPGFVARMKAAVKGLFGSIAKFIRDTKNELKKVVWPSKADVKTNTIVVLVVVAIAAVVMIVLDAIFGGVLGLVIGA